MGATWWRAREWAARKRARAVQAARAFHVEEVISAGLAGACDPALRVGEVVRAGVVIDRKTRERFVDSRFGGVLVTAEEIASVAEKKESVDGL